MASAPAARAAASIRPLSAASARDPERDIFRGRRVIVHRFLEQHRDLPPQCGNLQLPQVHAVQHDPSLLRVVEPAQQFDQGALARTVVADNGRHLSGLETERKILQRGALAAGIAERDPFKADTLLHG